MAQQLEPSFKGGLTGQANADGSYTVVVMVFLSLIIMACGGMLFFVNVVQNLFASELVFGLLITGLVVGGIASVVVVNALLKRLRQARFSDAVLTAEQPLRPGQAFEVRYYQEFHRDAEIEEVAITLIQREWVEYTSGTDTVTKTHDHPVRQHQLHGRRQRGGTPLGESLRFELPKHAMHTWAAPEPVLPPGTTPELLRRMSKRERRATLREAKAAAPPHKHPHNEISWHVHVAITFKGWPEYQQGFALTVEPTITTEESF